MAEGNRLVESVEVTDDKIHIVHLKAVFDASTVDEFEQVLEYLISNNFFEFVIDLNNVDFISSAGWGVFIGELQRVRDNKGDIKLTGMSTEVYDVYLLLELDMFIKAFNSIDEALQEFQQKVLGISKENEQKQPDKIEPDKIEPDKKEPDKKETVKKRLLKQKLKRKNKVR